jgi:hypothetical protein
LLVAAWRKCPESFITSTSASQDVAAQISSGSSCILIRVGASLFSYTHFSRRLIVQAICIFVDCWPFLAFSTTSFLDPVYRLLVGLPDTKDKKDSAHRPISNSTNPVNGFYHLSSGTVALTTSLLSTLTRQREKEQRIPSIHFPLSLIHPY